MKNLSKYEKSLVYGLATLATLGCTQVKASEWDELDDRAWHFKDGCHITRGEHRMDPGWVTGEGEYVDKMRATNQIGLVYQFGNKFRLGGAMFLGWMIDRHEVRNPDNGEWKVLSGSTFGFGVNGIVGRDFRFFTLDLGTGIQEDYEKSIPYGTVEVLADLGIKTLENNGLKLGVGVELSENGRLPYFTCTIKK